jgi:hypothetical protein
MGGDDMGADDMGADDMGGEEGGEDEMLLAEPPARRDDLGRRMYTSDNAKDKYYRPVGSRNPSGDRKKSYKSKYADEVGHGNIRNIYKGFEIAKGIYEEYSREEPNYKEGEEKLFKVNCEVKKLIQELESRDDEAKAQ